MYPDALAIAGNLRSSFDLHENISGRIHTNESVGLRILLGEVVDSTVGGIRQRPEVPTVKETRAFSSLCQFPIRSESGFWTPSRGGSGAGSPGGASGDDGGNNDTVSTRRDRR